MTSIHAPIPPHLKDGVLEAKRIGEEDSAVPRHDAPERPGASRASSSTASVVMKKRARSNAQDARGESDTRSSSSTHLTPDVSEDREGDDDTKENDPSHSPTPNFGAQESIRKNALGKRPLSELPTPIDPDATDSNHLAENRTTAQSDEEIPASQMPIIDDDRSSEPAKKSPKLEISARNLDNYGKVRQEDRPRLAKDEHFVISPLTDLGDDKENMEHVQRKTSTDSMKARTQQSSFQASEQPPRLTLRKVSNVGSSRSKGQARVGIRRL